MAFFMKGRQPREGPKANDSTGNTLPAVNAGNRFFCQFAKSQEQPGNPHVAKSAGFNQGPAKSITLGKA